MKGCIVRRGKKSWRLKFDAGPRDPVTGKRDIKFVTVHGTRRDAERELIKQFAALEAGTFVDPSRMTVSEYLTYWLDNYVKPKLTPKTSERYGEIISKHVTPAVGSHILQKLRTLHVQKLYTDASAKGLAPRSVIYIHRVLHKAFKQAKPWGFLAHNPADGAEVPRPQDAGIQILTEEQAKQLFAALKGTSLYLPVLLAFSTGMRRGEVLALRWRDVDLGEAIITVAQSLEETKDGLRFKAPKTNSSRRAITLPPRLIDELRAHKKAQAERRLALGLGKDEADLVFSTWRGKPRHPRGLTGQFRRAVADAGLKGITFHGLRHTHVSQLLAQGEHIKVVSERAGHSSIAVTLQVYAHAVPGMQKQTATRVDAMVRAALGE